MSPVYQVIDTQTGILMGSYTSRVRASRRADKLDLEYGAIRYSVKIKPEEATHMSTTKADWQLRDNPEETARCEKCSHPLGPCPRCQRDSDSGERYCSNCDWCEACGRNGKRP